MRFEGMFDKEAQRVLTLSARRAGLLGKRRIGTEHLLLGLTAYPRSEAGKLLAKAGVGRWNSWYHTVRLTGQGMPLCRPKQTSAHLDTVLDQAAVCAGQTEVRTEHLLRALIACRNCTARLVLEQMKADLPALERQTGTASAQQPSVRRAMGRMSAAAVLDRYATDLTELARCGKLDPVIGREEELFRLMTILQRRTKNNPVLLGDPGVGKTAVAEALALAIANGTVPKELQNARIVSIDMASLISGTKYRGEFEERLRAVVRELSASRNIIAFIDEVHTLVGAGSAEGAIDASNLLKPALARGEIRLIGTTTLEEYHKTIEKDAALERRFQRIDVPEPTEQRAVEILLGLSARYAAHHQVSITPDACKEAVCISVRTRPERHLPDKAIDLLDETCAAVHMRGGTVVSAKEIAAAAQRFDGFTAAAEGEQAKRLLQLEQTLKQHVIGQEQAIARICKAVRRGSAGLRDTARPVASLLLTGPTGVGKTSVCVELAEQLFGRDGLIRIDLSEYQQPHDVARLIGAPPGYKGYGEGGQLTERIRRRPRSLVLFDEVEKAHPDILRLLLRLLEDGRLTDGEGRSADFCHAVIIMTSNLGSGSSSRPVGFGGDAREKLQETVRQTLQPELAGRLDAVIPFCVLRQEDCIHIAERELQKLARRCTARGTNLQWDAAVTRHLGIADAKRGARAVRDAVAEQVTDPLASMMLAGEAGAEVHVMLQQDMVVLKSADPMLSGI